MSLWPYVWIHTVYAQTAFICIHTCAGQVLLKRTSALPNKGSHVFSDEQRSQMIRLCFRNMVAFCLQSVCWGWTQRHLYPRPLSNLNVYLVFLIGQSRLTELSEQFGRSVECSGVVAHLNSSTKNTPHPKKTPTATLHRLRVNWIVCVFMTGGDKAVQFMLCGFMASCRTFGTRRYVFFSLFWCVIDVSGLK